MKKPVITKKPRSPDQGIITFPALIRGTTESGLRNSLTFVEKHSGNKPGIPKPLTRSNREKGFKNDKFSLLREFGLSLGEKGGGGLSSYRSLIADVTVRLYAPPY